MKDLYTYLKSLPLLLFFIVTQASAQSPGGVATDNTVWLKANSGITLNSSNQVSNWAENSGANVTGDFVTNNPGAGGITQQPPGVIYNGVNFNPYIHFVSSSPNCISSSNVINGNQIFGSQQMTMFQVINLHTSVGTGVWCKWQTSNTAPGRLGDEINNGGVNAGKIRLDYRGSTLYSTSTVLNKHTLYTGMTNTSNNLIIRLAGMQDASMSTFGSNTNSGSARLSLGNENEAGGDPYPTTIDIAEFILYKRSLNAGEINKVESYLAVKYGITLAQTGTAPNNYLASDSSIIWNNALNTPYYNNITGIGIDNDGAGTSALHQKQSKSINQDALVTIYNGVYTSGNFPTTNDSNTNAIASNGISFLLFGDNMGDTNFNACADSGAIVRIGRVWKVQKTGSLINDVTLSIPNNILANAQSLLISTDSTFNTNVIVVPLSDNGILKYASYAFSSNTYFTFGTAPLALNAVVNNALCAGQNGSIVLNPVGGLLPYTYSWNSVPIQSTSTLSNVPSGTYTVTVTQGGCSYNQSYTLANNPAIIGASLTTDSSICTANNGSATAVGFGGQEPYVYQWDNSGAYAFENIKDNLYPGLHFVTVKDANGCTYDTSFMVYLINYTLQLQLDTVNSKCDLNGLGGSITVNVLNTNSMPPYTYTWVGATSNNSSLLNNISAGSYQVSVTDKYGCTGNASAQIDETPCCKLLMPSAFSPNGDGLNDAFQPEINTALNYALKIYNRWGQLVFNGYYSGTKGWDGTLDGKKADVGLYFYTLSYKCIYGDKTYNLKGEVNLIR